MESCELNLNYKDHCLIIVGDGGPSDELLARRRLLAGGRLAHFLVSEGQVKIRGEEPNVIFAWQPFNSSEAGMASPLGRKLGQSFKTYWTKTGADCIVVPPNHTLHIYTLNGQMRHVRLVHEQGHVLMEISGEVVLEPDDEVAGTWEVGVEDPELKAFGTFSKRYVLKSLVVVLVWHVMRWTVSIKFDGSAEDGQDPWWRGLLVVLSAVFLCAPGVWKNWAASLSGESDVDLMDKMVCTVAFLLVAIAATPAHLAELSISQGGLTAAILVGPFWQYYRTRAKYPERRFSSCLLWTAANYLATAGLATVLLAIVVGYRFLLAASRPVMASFFLPVSTAVVESVMVIYTRCTYISLVVQKRPEVPGDISYVPIPYMLTALHGLAECARVAAVFSGAVTTGEYAWVGSVVLTLLLNVMARCGWTRLCLFLTLKKAAGLKRALFFAPTAFGKLHDEIKIYAGYFRFPAIFALVLSRALVYQNLSLSGPGSPVYNASAGAALLCLLVAEYLEDFIVIQQIVPMSPVLPELIDYDLQKSSRHTSYLSAEVRRMCPNDSQTGWRLDELNDSGFRKSGARTLQMTSPCGDRSMKMSSIVPLPEISGVRVPGPSIQAPRLVFIPEPDEEPQTRLFVDAPGPPDAPAHPPVLLVNAADDSRRANSPRQSVRHVISNSSQPKSDVSNMSDAKTPAGSLDVRAANSQRQSMLDVNVSVGRQLSNGSIVQRNSSKKSMLGVNVPIGRHSSNDSNAQRANSPRQSIFDVNVPIGRQVSGDSCPHPGNSPRESVHDASPGRQISNNSSLQKSDASSLSEDAKALAPAVSGDVSTAPLGRQISSGSNRQRDSPRPSILEVNVGMQRQISNDPHAHRATSPRRSRLEPNVADERQFSNSSFPPQKSNPNVSEDANMPQLVASLGKRGDSKPSAIRRWFGQERAVQPSLLLHGLRELPWDCQLSAVAVVCEVTCAFLNTTLGPGYVRGVAPAPCKDFDVWGAVIWISPLRC